MINYQTMSELEIIEALAEYENMISSEDELSERFDDMVDEFGLIYLIGSDELDEPAMCEWFNNWTDALCKDGEIHSTQYSEYCYCGKFDF